MPYLDAQLLNAPTMEVGSVRNNDDQDGDDQGLFDMHLDGHKDKGAIPHGSEQQNAKGEKRDVGLSRVAGPAWRKPTPKRLPTAPSSRSVLAGAPTQEYPRHEKNLQESSVAPSGAASSVSDRSRATTPATASHQPQQQHHNNPHPVQAQDDDSPMVQRREEGQGATDMTEPETPVLPDPLESTLKFRFLRCV